MLQGKGMNTRSKSFTSMIVPTLLIMLFFSLIALIGVWEFYGREQLLYGQVIVLKDDIQRGTAIDVKTMITYVRAETDKVIDNAIVDPSKLDGLLAAHYIPKNTQLHPSYFVSPNLITNEKQKVVKIPNEWLLSVPNTLRRMDIIEFYPIRAVSEGNKQLPTTSIQTIPQTSTDPNANKANTNDTAADSLITHDSSQETKYTEILSNSLFETTVAYVKDANNREVIDVGASERMDASSKISDIEAIITDEQLQMLKEYYQNGYKFIILYAEGVN